VSRNNNNKDTNNKAREIILLLIGKRYIEKENPQPSFETG
jgi:hypothetical protein